MKHVAVYVRVSSNGQDTKSQEPDLKRWAAAQDTPVTWYRDKASGKSMDRPGWSKLETAIEQGKVSAVVVWRIDRLGRTAKGLTALFDDLRERKVNLVSLKDGLDLSTSAGRLMANVLASVAQYETEVRAERVKAGQAVEDRKQGAARKFSLARYDPRGSAFRRRQSGLPLADQVLNPMWRDREALRRIARNLSRLCISALMQYRDMGSFMAAQVIADLKYVEPLLRDGLVDVGSLRAGQSAGIESDIGPR